VALPASRVAALPETVPVPRAAALPLAGITAMGLLRRRYRETAARLERRLL
jgi:NADPH:quinone reductase-like Zn-dependent oxidoreductase